MKAMPAAALAWTVDVDFEMGKDDPAAPAKARFYLGVQGLPVAEFEHSALRHTRPAQWEALCGPGDAEVPLLGDGGAWGALIAARGGQVSFSVVAHDGDRGTAGMTVTVPRGAAKGAFGQLATLLARAAVTAAQARDK
jgi:hypothetical protein